MMCVLHDTCSSSPTGEVEVVQDLVVEVGAGVAVGAEVVVAVVVEAEVEVEEKRERQRKVNQEATKIKAMMNQTMVKI